MDKNVVIGFNNTAFGRHCCPGCARPRETAFHFPLNETKSQQQAYELLREFAELIVCGYCAAVYTLILDLGDGSVQIDRMPEDDRQSFLERISRPSAN